jgi:hypothetical protein
MTVPEASVAVELERLRGTVATNFAEVKGSLAVLVEQSNRTKEDVRRLRDDTDKALAEQDQRLTALERNRWPLPTISVLAGVAGAATGAVALFAR